MIQIYKLDDTNLQARCTNAGTLLISSKYYKVQGFMAATVFIGEMNYG